MNRPIITKLFNLVVGICVVLCAYSCRSSKTATNYPTEKCDTAACEEKANLHDPVAYQLAEVASTYKDWNDVEIPVELELLKPREFSVSGRATMVKNQSIYISIRVLGFEAANIYVNNDSIHATYKLGKLYIAEDVKKLLKGYPVSVGDLQNLILGRAFVIGKGTFSPKLKGDMKIESNGNIWYATPYCNVPGVNYQFAFDDSTNILKLLTVLIQGANPVLCNYSDTDYTSVGNIAQSLLISANTNKQSISASIKWNADKAKWNTGAKPKWKAPKGYKKVNAEDLLKAFNE